MNAYVHYRLTKRWAAEAGLSERDAEKVATADIAVNAAHPGGLLHPHNWSYHYRLFGATRLGEAEGSELREVRLDAGARRRAVPGRPAAGGGRVRKR